jgi:Flp pilus assembly protein TadD
MNRPGDAEAYLNDALQLEPDNASFHYHLGLALFQSGDRAGSRQELKTALAGNLNAADRAGVQNFVEKITH